MGHFKPTDAIAQKELLHLVDDFINEAGMWIEWKEFVKSRGYSLKELGFIDEESDDDDLTHDHL